MIDSWVAAVVGGYLLGSIPVAVLAGRARGFDPRQVGDSNPGFWNMKDQLGWAGAVPVLAGDTLKGTAAGLAGLILAHGIFAARAAGRRAPRGEALVYAAVAAAMIGHAWPVFARLRGGRSVLTFAGGFAVICPPPSPSASPSAQGWPCSRARSRQARGPACSRPRSCN